MDGSFVVLLVRCHIVGREKGEARADVWACACSEPVDAADDALIDLGAAFQVWIVRIRVGNGINGNSRAIGSHVGDGVEFVHTKAMAREFGECGLAKMDGEMAVVVAGPSERKPSRDTTTTPTTRETECRAVLLSQLPTLKNS